MASSSAFYEVSMVDLPNEPILATPTSYGLSQITAPKVLGQNQLGVEHALELVSTRSGLILTPEHRLSLPFTVETTPEGVFLRSHIPSFATAIISELTDGNEIEVLFDTAGYYIDPTLILRETAHAPTEVKAVFSISGHSTLLECSKAEAIAHLDRVRAYKQMIYAPKSDFTVPSLPDRYLSDSLPQIRHFAISVETLETFQLMALTHLQPDHRRYIIDKLLHAGDPQAFEAARIISFFMNP